MRYLTPVRIDETNKRNKARHAFSMIRQGIRDDLNATTTAGKLAAQKKKMAGQARSGRAYWGAYAAKETAASKNEKNPVWKRQTAKNLADWAKEKGQQAKGRQKRVSDSIVPLTMDSLMETAIEKREKPRLGMIHNPPTPKLSRSISKPSPNGKKVKPSVKPFVKEDNDLLEGKYKDQREAGNVKGPIAKAAMNKLRGSKGKMVNGKLKPATSKAARESYKRAARAAAGTSKPAKAPEDRLPEPRGGDAGSTEANIRSAGDRR